MIAILFVATFFALVVKCELHGYLEWAMWRMGEKAMGRWDDRANVDFWLLTSDYSSQLRPFSHSECYDVTRILNFRVTKLLEKYKNANIFVKHFV